MKAKARSFLILFVVVAAAVSVVFLPSKTAAIPRQIQTPIQTHDHTLNNANVIDGSVHPEMIQDKDAYRLFFLTVATGSAATLEDTNRQRAFLRPMQLSESQLLTAQAILADFKTRYQSASAKYNASAEAALANNMTPDIEAFLKERDDIVLSARVAMEKTLGQETWSRFDAHVQKEKRRMKVAVEDHR